MSPEGTSAAGGTVQEQGGQSVPGPVAPPAGGAGVPGTNLEGRGDQARAAASEAGPGAQEQPTGTPSAPPTGEEKPPLSEAERLRRLEQSLRDKAIAAARAEFLRLQQAEAERQRLAAMDDEQLGATVRRQQELEAYAQQRLQQIRAAEYAALTEQTLAIVKDEKERETIAARNEAGEFKSFYEFQQACIEAQLRAERAKLTERIQKEVREAVTKELVAQQTEGGPQLGSGAPSTVVDLRKMSTDEKLLYGLEQEQRKGRGREA